MVSLKKGTMPRKQNINIEVKRHFFFYLFAVFIRPHFFSKHDIHRLFWYDFWKRCLLFWFKQVCNSSYTFYQLMYMQCRKKSENGIILVHCMHWKLKLWYKTGTCTSNQFNISRKITRKILRKEDQYSDLLANFFMSY